MLRKLWADDAGLVISAELVLVLTIGVLMLVVGLHAVSKSINHELSDIAGAIGAVNQTYTYDGFKNPNHAFAAGSAFGPDGRDDCDCAEIIQIRPFGKRDVGDGSNTGEAGFGGFGGGYGGY